MLNNQKNMRKRILGLDTGTNSLGWAVVDKNNDGTYTLIDKGSLIFQEGVKDEKGNGNEVSRAAERTSYRALRRQYFRRRLRKIELLKVLVKHGLCPTLSEEDLNLWHTKKIYPKRDAFMEWQRTNENSESNPYYYRHVCLTEELDLSDEQERFILGRALYHLAQRRGFLSNRLDQSEGESEDGDVKSGISNLTKEMAAKGCEYLGDFFYKLYREKGNTERIRTRYTDRNAHYKKEFYAICKKQNLEAELVGELERALYFQRPLKSQRFGVGKCMFEPKKQRCADSHPAYERFRMWAFINNVKVKCSADPDLRPLNEEERKIAEQVFYVKGGRKSKTTFDFEDIAKAIAGKGKYQYINDAGDKEYKFNYRMSQGVAGCQTIAALRSVFGDDYLHSIAETYTKADNKSLDDIENNIWNVLYFFSSEEKLKEFAVKNLQLDDDLAAKFSKIRLSRGFASLSLKAIRRILPFLEQGYRYDSAVLLANVPYVMGDRWNVVKDEVMAKMNEVIYNYNPKDVNLNRTLECCIKDILEDDFNVEASDVCRLYHPSMIDVYPDAKEIDGVLQLGSPKTDSVRNPMAMRSLHEMRKVINTLLRNKIIDQNTEVHVEYARELNDANKRKALFAWNKSQNKLHDKYRDDIIRLFKEATGKTIEPTKRDILKFKLWEEQNHICIYTGEEIGIADFLCKNPKFDIEHTVPQSAGGDSTEINLTLCNSRFNREVKRTKLPTQLAEHEEIINRISEWKDKIDELSKKIDRLHTNGSMTKEKKDAIIQKRHLLKIEKDYWKGKYSRFTMTEVPEGFSLRQGAGIGLISKYAALFLKSLFHKPNDRNRSNVRTIKGQITAEFRRLWGIQDEYEAKSRDNHVHHCIDAVTIACIGAEEYSRMASFYHDEETYNWDKSGSKPTFPKPWATFAEDMKKLKDEVVVVHSTTDNMPKQGKRRIKTSVGMAYAQGDSARAALHKDTNYGAIERDGKIKYVVRKQLADLKESDIENIVDEVVKEKVRQAVKEKGLNQAVVDGIYMNEKKRILIKKVRCIVPTVTNPLSIRHHRDESKKEYKQQYHVALDSNYCMAIYEGRVNGKIQRKYEVVNMLDAARFYRKSSKKIGHSSMVQEEKNGLKYRCKVMSGTHVLLLQNDDEVIDVTDKKVVAARLYYVAIISADGRLLLRNHQEARRAGDLKSETNANDFCPTSGYRSQIRWSMSNFHALVENSDFTIDKLGNVRLIKK